MGPKTSELLERVQMDGQVEREEQQKTNAIVLSVCHNMPGLP